ncbi:hypothetical protein F8388_018845 [Cannabis sativa]|uniref:BURP domain-containing protein n=1 Tax=Cannabis sativa TaxID=3483 RepID=A0A7J6I7J1_CANSA|nr:hypothetical protein F8388_018845 [Cannabis sativa]KAF4403582.1 hypothetical protein G4B88_002435 [Cannabis sativa]
MLTTSNENIQQRDQGYISGYAPRTSEKRSEVSDDVINNRDSYISGYGSREIEKEKEVSNDFINNHQGYISGYGSGAREAEVSNDLVNNHQGYIAGYGPKTSEKEQKVHGDAIINQHYTRHHGKDKEKSEGPCTTTNKNVQETNDHLYITTYGKVEQKNELPYMTQYGNAKQTNKKPYITSYGKVKQKNELPYMTQYGNAKQTNEKPYITSYEKAEQKNELPYMTQYGNAKQTNEKPYITSYEKVEQKNELPYMTQYGNAKQTNEKPYITSYGKAEQNNELPYMTQYGNARQTNEKPYITSYGKFEQKNELPYMTQYGNAKQTNEKPYIKHIHAVSSSNNVGDKHIGHGNDIQQSSIDSDRAKAFKQGFFTPDDLSAKKVMALNFPIQEHSRFLPKEVADSIPFSLSQLPNLLQLFSIIDGSSQARDMEETIKDCRIKPIESEVKSCATSLESMVEFVHSILGSEVNFNLLSTTHPTMSTALTQNYTILEVPKEVLAPKVVVCHPVPYPYAIFLCHHFGTETKVFQASLGGKNGNNVEAVAICHMDTSHWDPTFILFQLLRVKPGVTSPICHFLPTNHLVWIPSPLVATT